MIIWFECVAVWHEAPSVYEITRCNFLFHDAFIISIKLTPIRLLQFSLDGGSMKIIVRLHDDAIRAVTARIELSSPSSAYAHAG